MVLRVTSALLTFGASVLLARILGPDGYGVYSYALALATLLAVPAQAGLPNLVVRETASGLARQEFSLVRGVWVWAGRAAVVVSVILAVGGVVVMYLVYEGDFDERAWALLWGFVLIPLVALGNLRGAALRGLHRIVAGQLPEFLLQPGLIVLFFGAIALLANDSVSPARAMSLHVLAATIAFGSGAWLLWKYTPTEVRQVRPRFTSKAWAASTLPLAFLAGMGIINQQADIVMLGVFKTSGQVGVYRVSVQIARLASFGLQAINLVLAPQIARLWTEGEMSRLQQLITRSTRFVFGLSLAVTLTLVVFGRGGISVVFGEQFIASYLPLVILVVGQLVNATTGSVGFLLNMTGHERETARGVFIAAVINIALNLALIPRWGASGAAVATMASMCTWNVLLWWRVRVTLGINSLPFGGTKHVD